MPNEAALTLDDELDRQMKSVRRGETEAVVCPWHGAILNVESGDCCVEMEDARDRLSKAHLQSIERQFAGARRGIRDSLQCPYCDAINRPENLESPAHWKRPGVNPWCCDSMVLAVMALSDRLIVQSQLDHKRRIEDGIAKGAAN